MGIVRIELHHERNYNRLHDEMEGRGYSQTIEDRNGRRHRLPRGLYWKAEPTDNAAMLEDAKDAARAAGEQRPMIVVTQGPSRFDGLPYDDD